MRYFKCLSNDYKSWLKGEIYPENILTRAGEKIRYYITHYPKDWEEVPNPNKVTIKDSYEIF